MFPTQIVQIFHLQGISYLESGMHVAPSDRMMNPMVLCIDDEPTVLATRKMVLQAAGFSVLTAPGGREGLAIFNSVPIDAVVLDYYMPELKGDQVASEMKRLKPDVPIVMLSAYVVLPEGALDSVDAFITKGEHPTILLRKLRALMNKQAA
jgi:CheY-like chemotaxis protein